MVQACSNFLHPVKYNLQPHNLCTLHPHKFRIITKQGSALEALCKLNLQSLWRVLLIPLIMHAWLLQEEQQLQ